METPHPIAATPSTASFEQLAIPLLPSLLRQALWLTQNEAEAEDLAQEALSKALRAFDSFTPGHELQGMDLPHPAQHLSHLAHRHRGHANLLP